ncbi:MAG: SRPBCC family protein [Actinomycetota bacterium]|nr:SRPBCC family protein [Actinomycetota bacterium]
MARIELSVHIEAAPDAVWRVLVDWEAQPRWMVDARSVTVLSPQREGAGVVLRCRTDIVGGLVVTDDMVTTDWVEGATVGVRHLGWLIGGVGAFELEPTAHGTRLTWWEELDPPFGVVGDTVAGVLAVPHVQRVFRRSLANLKRICEGTGG